MKAFAMAGLVLMMGCASFGDHPAFEEAFYVDREFGEAQQYSWDLVVAHPDRPYAHQKPEGLPGVAAENVMDVHVKTYAERPAKVPVLTLGVVGE